MSYIVRYYVEAVSRLDAITKATAMLRTGVKLNGVADVQERPGGWWDVSLHVWEDA